MNTEQTSENIFTNKISPVYTYVCEYIYNTEDKTQNNTEYITQKIW